MLTLLAFAINAVLTCQLKELEAGERGSKVTEPYSLYCNVNLNKEERESNPMSAQISNVLNETSLSRKFPGFGSEFFSLCTEECRILPWQ